MRISEIYSSIQGETQYAGLPCTLVRTTGCDLRCSYCDTTHAFHGGKVMSLHEILDAVDALGVRFVLLTGGEPMLQPDLPELAERLLGKGYMVSIETSGAHSLARIPSGVIRIVDVKTPSSGESSRLHPEALLNLTSKDAIKFVLADEEDYRWTLKRIGTLSQQHLAPEILLSPVHDRLSPQTLIAWILRDKLNVRVNLQLHKYIWGTDARGV